MSNLSLHEKQYDVYKHRAKFKVVAAGRRWGKSRLSQVSLITKAADNRGSLNWYVAPSYKMAKQIMWEPMNQLIPKSWIRKKNETELRFDLINGSTIVLKGADKADSLRGVGLNYVVLDEMHHTSRTSHNKYS
jgi:hypothetical protein